VCSDVKTKYKDTQMATNYYNISIEEMTAFLTPLGFLQIELNDGTTEAVFGKRVDQDNLPLSLRIYTGIAKSGESRDKGKDAIRVVLFGKFNDKPVMLGGSKRVHRVENWQKNLKARIDGWLDYMPKHKCPKCQSPLLVRENKQKKSKFLGCANYPTCNYTQNV
jgi:hypothetical protein